MSLAMMISRPARRLQLRLLLLPLLFLTTKTLPAAVGITTTPAAVSNLYSGTISLTVTGLNSGETVIVQKYLDANSNGVVDAGDFLVQQFQLTDGVGPTLFGSVTNINIPYDSNPTAGAITALLNLRISGLAQEIVGQFAYVVSNPTNRFPAVTNLFNVTNSAYAGSFTGHVICNGTNVPYAVVTLGAPGTDLHPLAAAVANNSGLYTLKVAPGSYKLFAFKNNFVFDRAAAPVVTLGTSAITTNLFLLPSDQTISGRLVNTTNANLGLPGMIAAAFSTNGLGGFGFSGSTGNFTIPISSAAVEWYIGTEPDSLAIQGYLSLNDEVHVLSSTGSVSGVTIALPKATAIIYGSVKDGQNNPLPGVKLNTKQGNNDSGPYQGRGVTDQNGNYVAGIIAGNWSANTSSDNDGRFPDYNFSEGPPWTYNNGGNGTNAIAGTTALANFTGLRATNHITGRLTDSDNNALSNINVYASANISGNSYSAANVVTDGTGNYSLSVVNGPWNVGVECGNNGGLDQSQYECPNSQMVTILNNNHSGVDFVAVILGAHLISGYVNDDLGNPVSGVHVYGYMNGSSTISNVTDAIGYYELPVRDGQWTIHLDCNDLASLGFTCAEDQSVLVSGNDVFDIDFLVSISPLQITTLFLPNATQNQFYSTTLAASGGQPPYQWTLSLGSANLPSSLALGTNDGVISGIAANPGMTYFIAQVTDALQQTATQVLAITVDPDSNNPMVVLTAPTRLADGRFQFSFDTTVGVNYTIEFSTTLDDWTPILTLTGPGGPLTIVDPAATHGDRRFYRIEVGP